MTRSKRKPRNPRRGRGGFAQRCSRFRAVTPVAVLLIAAACSGVADGADDPAIAQGRTLYEANCMACHGEEALGDGPMAARLPVATPSLLDHLGHHTRSQLIQLIQDGVPPAMPPSPVSAEEIQLIVDYVWTLVPESEVADLRAMQQQMEMMEDPAMAPMPGMHGMGDMPGMDHGDSAAASSTRAP